MSSTYLMTKCPGGWGMSASRQSWLQELSSQVKKYSVIMMRVTGDECIHTN